MADLLPAATLLFIAAIAKPVGHDMRDVRPLRHALFLNKGT